MRPRGICREGGGGGGAVFRVTYLCIVFVVVVGGWVGGCWGMGGGFSSHCWHLRMSLRGAMDETRGKGLHL